MRALLLALVACGSAAPPTGLSNASHPVEWGTATPYRIVTLPPDGRWILFCQARADTNHDGKIHVYNEMHGEDAGDTLLAYLVDPQGNESIVDNHLATEREGRWLVVVEHGTPILIDSQTWHRTPLAGTLPRTSIVGGRTDWTFSPDGTRLLYWRNGGPIVRELASGHETVIAKRAWTATWNHDGSWVELETLVGDTNRDGFTHGPNLSPSEGVPGHDCGNKREYGDSLSELLPGTLMNDPHKLEAALASIENPDDLARSIWRVSDGRVVTAEHAIDRTTIMTKLADHAFAIGPLDGTQRPIGDCVLDTVYGAAAIVQCKVGNETSVQWIGAGDRELYRGPADPLVMSEDGRWIEVYVKPTGTVIDMTSGDAVPTPPDYHHAWNDDTRYALRSWHDDKAPLVFVAPDHAPIQLANGGIRGPSGHWMTIDRVRLDLDTLAVKSLGKVEPIGVRSDGAILTDTGDQSTDPYDHWRIGPIRWTIPND
ncbi:MAG: hypothetical protein QM831_07320 [Kofleriaceae bacterium]